MARKGCELCSSPARMFCESDQASLCWGCDEKVHAANFLVAKHSRTLLCHVCHSPTPWTASGLKLGPTVSVCHGCADGGVANRGGSATSSRRRDDDDDDDGGGGYDSPESESDDGEYYIDSEGFSEDEEEEEDGENQVVPWSDTGSNSPPAEAAAELARYSDGEDNVSLSSSKRTRENAFESEDENMCCSSGDLDLNQRESGENVGCSSSSARPSKMRRRSNGGPSPEQAPDGNAPPSGTAAIVEKLRRFHQEIAAEGEEASAVILGLCKLNKD
ncbi:B-box zinc finger protein 32 [Phtheirospermum japonicum]|uniref:B-box zinc finger protein 32 n=1 Tax=Phtheirospermum japonicum TaxID=374723 RepID=A0A830D0S2_9LAMI|nr:B-box zinc finger protein 32 [Phtheirospermum japonicum]